MREDLDALEKMGADFITMNAEDVWGNIQITIKAYSYRMETDDEYEARLVEEKRAEERQLKRDIELFEQLKKKLGKTTT